MRQNVRMNRRETLPCTVSKSPCVAYTAHDPASFNNLSLASPQLGVHFLGMASEP